MTNKKCKPCPSEAQIKELEQLSRIFSSDLSQWSHTETRTVKNKVITRKGE